MWWRHCMDNSSDILVNLKGFLLDNWLCSKNNKNIYESSIKCTEVTSIQNMPQRWQSNWVFYKYFERCCCLCLVSSTRSRITFCQIGFIRWKPGLAVLEVMGRESWVRCLEFKSNNRQILDGKLPLFVLKWAIPSLFLFIFVFSNKHYTFYYKIMWKCPSSIRCRDSNLQPSAQESPPITTRPGLPSSCYLLKLQKMKCYILLWSKGYKLKTWALLWSKGYKL